MNDTYGEGDNSTQKGTTKMSDRYDQSDITEAVLLSLLNTSIEAMERIHKEAERDNNFSIYGLKLDANEWNSANVEMANFILTYIIEPLEVIGSDVSVAVMKLSALMKTRTENKIEMKLIQGGKSKEPLITTG